VRACSGACARNAAGNRRQVKTRLDTETFLRVGLGRRIDNRFHGGGERRPLVGSVDETITVSGASPVVDTQNVRSQSVLSRELLDTLPTARTFSAFASLTPGVSAERAGM